MGNQHPPSLPQNDPDLQTRQENITNAKGKYQLEQKTFALKDIEQRQVNIVNLQPMLKFECRYVFYAFYEFVFGRGRWTIDQMIQFFKTSWILQKPKNIKASHQTKELKMCPRDFQQFFGRPDRQKLPRFLPFVDVIETNHPCLNDEALAEHAENNQLFVVDLTEVALNEPRLLAPIALFVIHNDLLMPVAIQIDQNNDNGIFRPPPLNLIGGGFEDMQQWVKARMWFNMLGAQYHESITHLGFTHLLMDGVSVCLHRHLSDRHPIYKLMLPHFRYMHFINELALSKLLQVRAFVDEDMYFGRKQMMELIGSRNVNWNLLDQSLPNDLNNRGVMNLPGYHFRDDALLLHGAIQNYVQQYVSHYYGDDDEAVQLDQEIQNFRNELTAVRTLGGNTGCGMQGIPVFNGIENLVTTLTNFIYICSVAHSATNFPQYDQYGFPPNMPATLHGQPENVDVTLDTAMPTGHELFSTIKVMRVLTTVLTSSLGNYEAVYLNAMDDAGRGFVQGFRAALEEIEAQINVRNAAILENPDGQVQDYPYEWLLPSNVLNSISI